MDIFSGIQAAQSVQGLLGLAMELVQEILRARRDVHDLPKNIKKLCDEVEPLTNMLGIIEINIQNFEINIQNEDSLVKRQLKKLSLELVRASEKVNELQNKQPEGRSEALRALLMALVKKGATKQQKDITIIREDIKREYGELVNTVAISTHLTVKQIEIMVRGLVDQASRVPLINVAEEPPIIAQLESLAIECDDNEAYTVSFEIDKNDGDGFLPPGDENRISTANNDGDEESERRRGAKEGGFLVKNNTLVKFEIEVDHAFLYVLSFERGLPNTTDLELFFPTQAKQANKIASSRYFPDMGRYKTDPRFLRLEKGESLREGAIGQVLLFIVLSDEALTQDKGKVDKNQIIQELLNLKDGSEEEIYVKRFLFDIK